MQSDDRAYYQYHVDQGNHETGENRRESKDETARFWLVRNPTRTIYVSILLGEEKKETARYCEKIDKVMNIAFNLFVEHLF